MRGSEEPETSEAAVAAVATLKKNDVSHQLKRQQKTRAGIPEECAKHIDARWGKGQGARCGDRRLFLSRRLRRRFGSGARFILVVAFQSCAGFGRRLGFGGSI